MDTGIIVAIISGLVVIYQYYRGQKDKRKFEEFQRKEIMFSGLLTNIRGFYRGVNDLGMKNEFIRQYNLCWMYCSDDVIRKLNTFIEAAEHNLPNREILLGEAIIAIRYELIIRHVVKYTSLKPNEFKILTASKIRR